VGEDNTLARQKKKLREKRKTGVNFAGNFSSVCHYIQNGCVTHSVLYPLKLTNLKVTVRSKTPETCAGASVALTLR